MLSVEVSGCEYSANKCVWFHLDFCEFRKRQELLYFHIASVTMYDTCMYLHTKAGKTNINI